MCQITERVGQWWQRHVTGGPDAPKDYTTTPNVLPQDSTLPQIDIPDFPDKGTPIGDLISDQLSGIAMGVITDILWDLALRLPTEDDAPPSESADTTPTPPTQS